MNEETVLETSKNSNEDISSSETSNLDNSQEVHTSEPVQVQDYTELLEQVQQINQKLDNITNLSIVCMVGVGMIVGIIACNIYIKLYMSF